MSPLLSVRNERESAYPLNTSREQKSGHEEDQRYVLRGEDVKPRREHPECMELGIRGMGIHRSLKHPDERGSPPEHEFGDRGLIRIDVVKG
jgi:hypothetical protein